ncbi:MAG: hypothetical protein WC955_08620 [Elusimicrobiota bacterium]
MVLNKYLHTIFYTFILTLTFHAYLHADSFRNILSLTSYNYTDDTASHVIEDTFMEIVKKKLTYYGSIYYDSHQTWSNKILSLGGAYLLFPGNYFEAYYGYGINSLDSRADYLTLAYNIEGPSYYLNISYRLSSFSGYSYHLISPGGRYFFIPRFSVWLKPYFSIDTTNNFNYSLWIQTEYRFSQKYVLKLGTVIGDITIDNISVKPVVSHFVSGIAGIDYEISDKLTVKYVFEYLTNESNTGYYKNNLVLDIRFDIK